MIFTGQIVVLRPITVEDAEITWQWRHSKRAKFLQNGSQTVAAQASWITATLQTDDLTFIIEYRDKPVGMIALQDINRQHKHAVLGRLLIGEPEWVQNAPVAFEAEMLLCDYVFNTLLLHKIHGEIMEDNIAMIKTREYLGYKKDGCLRDHYFHNGTFKNAIAVSLTEPEYRQITRPKLNTLIELFKRMA